MSEHYAERNDSPELTLYEAPDAEERAEELLDLGFRHAEGGRYEEAAQVFEQVVEAAPQNPVYRLNLASALQDLVASGAVEPTRADDLTERAREHLLDAIHIDPEFAPAYRSLGFLYRDLDAPWRAREMWHYYLEMDPDGPFSREVSAALDGLDRLERLRGMLEEASYLTNHGDAEQAVQMLREVTEEEGSWHEAWFWLGLACRELELLDQGIEAFGQARKLDPQSPYILHELASLLARKGEREAAEGFWRKALELEPDEPWIMTNLAFLLWREERRPEAEALILSALEADPANRKLRKRLDGLRSGEPAPTQEP